jgi:hypothetical protein
MMKGDLVVALVALVICVVSLGFAVNSLLYSLAVLRALGG